MVSNGRDCFTVCLSYPITATIEARSSDFKGSATDVLLATISDYLDKDKECYTRLSSIVNSGIGKSCMVNEILRKTSVSAWIWQQRFDARRSVGVDMLIIRSG